jgi:pyruvate dehydrogenase E2 component (dihydrolipoamide acetyltransferase)
MAKDFKFPDVGEGITEGEIVKWVVNEGDHVEADQTIVEVETDKAVVELPSPYAGTVLKILVKEKDIVKVGDVLVTIGEEGEDITGKELEIEVENVEKDKPAPALVGEIKESSQEIIEIKATPKVRRLAKEMSVDLKTVQGTGYEGRITEEDILKTKGKEPEILEPVQQEKKPPVKIKAKFDFYGGLERIPLRGIRRATARKMSESVNKAAHVTHFEEADATELVRIREGYKQKANQKTIKLTFLPFIVKAVVAALKEHPLLNAILDDEDEEIIIKKYFNIGIAVDVPDGLIVPVIKAADQKSLFDLAEEIQKLAEGAKERSLDLADLQGGTFSITNVGMLGGEFATPIINYPEVAILATMRIKDRVRVENGGIKIKKTLPLCLSFDHRVLDGAEAARFMNDLIQFLENPRRLDLSSKKA